MKNFMKKILLGFLPALFISMMFIMFSATTGATEEFRYERVCANGICIVTVYNSEGSIVNVYEELDGGGN
jgi:hypothetical protein